MVAIYKRELKAYFTTFIGYAFIASFLILSGIFFTLAVLSQANDADITVYYTGVIFSFIVLIPLLTMKLFSDEKKLRTETLLLTAPVNLFSVVLGKFFASFTMFLLTMASASINLIPMYVYGEQNTMIILGNMLSIVLMGGAFIAVGIFLSAMTENQLVAAVSTIAVIASFLVIGMFSTSIGFTPLRVVLNFFSVFNRYTYFTYGMIDYAALIYYFSITVLFVFLTVRVLERRRWA
ncbi:MAG: ABC transporter [Clostridia bacterium]|nr:ABC transporter [Clostridia bacterium]